MQKKVLTLVLLLSLLILVLLYMRIIRLPFLPLHPHQVIPAHTAYFLEIDKKGLDKLDLSPDDFSTLLELCLPKNLNSDYKLLNHFLGDAPGLADQKITVTVNPSKTQGIDLLYILDQSSNINLNDIINKTEEWHARKYYFKNQELVTLRNEGNVCSIAKLQNLLIFAEHAYLVENAISQFKRPAESICSNKRFRAFYKQSDKATENLRVYFYLENLIAQFAPLLNAAKFNQLKYLESTGDWVNFTIPINGNGNAWTGSFLPPGASPVVTINQGANSELDENIWQAVPDNLAALMAFKLNGNQNVLTDQYLRGQLGHEIAVAFGEAIENMATEQLWLVALKDGATVEQLLNQRAAKSQISDYQMFQIWELNEQTLPRFITESNSYATIIENYLLIGKNKPTLEKWLGKYLAGQTLSSNISFLQLKSQLPPKSNGVLYLDGIKGWQQIAPFFNEDVLLSLNRNPLPFDKMVASIVWENGIGNLHFASTRQTTNENQTANILWNAPLQNPAKTKPLVTTNPQNGEKEIFILDIKNRIYLISRSGRIRWQRQINEPVISEITSIDLNKSDEQQFVFSTSSAIYVIDQKGKNLDGFPLKLQVPATNGVTVIDFFQSNDYSFFVACENGKAYGFDEKGSPIEGWRPNEDIGTVKHPILHFQAGGKDFLNLLDVDGTLRVFKKNGTPRFKKIAFEQTNLAAPNYQLSKKSSRIVTADSSGRVYISNLSGDHFRLQLTNEKNSNIGFLFTDVTGDDRKDYMALSKNKISINYYDKNKFKKGTLIEYPWPQDDIFEVTWGRSRKSFIGSINKNKNLIFLMDGNGKIPDQFPLAGSTHFVIEDLIGDGKPVVLTGNKNAVTAYSLE